MSDDSTVETLAVGTEGLPIVVGTSTVGTGELARELSMSDESSVCTSVLSFIGLA